MELNGATLRAWREECGIAQQEIADRFDVNIRSVKRWESGRYDIPAEVATWIAETRERMRDTASEFAGRAITMAKETGMKKVIVKYYRTQSELDDARSDSGMPHESYGFVNATSRLAASIIEGKGIGVEYYYPTQVAMI